MFQTLAAQTVVLLLKRLFLNLQLHDTPSQLIQLCGHGIQLCLDQSTRLIHKVDGLIRQETVGNIPVGKGSRSHKGAVRDLHTVEYFIAFLQTTQNGNGVLNCRLIYHNRLETTLQRRVLLNVLTVLVKSGCSDTVELAPCQHWL